MRLPGVARPLAQVRRAGLKRNVVSSYAARILNAATGFVLFPFVAAHVGLADYGIWLLLSSVGLIFVGLDLGLGSSIARYVADAGTPGSERDLERTLHSSFVLYAALGVAAAVLFGLTMLLVWPTLGIPPGSSDDALVMAVLVCAGLLLVGVPLSAARQMLAGIQRLDVANLILIAQLVVRVVAVVITIALGGGIVVIAAIEVGVVVGGSLAAVVAVARLTPTVRLGVANADRALMRTMVGFSLKVFVLGAAAIVILQTDNLIIGAFLGTAAVTLYAGAFRFYQFCREISGVVMNAMIPEASRAVTLGDHARLRRVLLRGTALANASVLLIVVPVGVFAGPLLTEWGGDDFAGLTGELRVLLASLVVNSYHLVALGILVGMGVVGRYARYHVIWAAANIVLTLALIGPLDLMGVALGTALPILVLEPLYIRHALRVVGVGARTFARESVLPSLVAAVVAGLPLWALAEGRDITTLPAILAGSAAYAVVFALVLWRAHRVAAPDAGAPPAGAN